ncbi:hypothetical protein [Ruminococcus albus]|uniref:Uncharacterized protein n=1 Tax=Ruminococcus albus TaxID=1264 RepID=A0A1I1FYQ7_RUMAL|nr:hypothetical protein [Ruminococcus albus]SFC04166.1 hypothetical protein SAMN02910406_01052 [Ruminococcus albus]
MLFALICIVAIFGAGILLFSTVGLAIALIGALFMGISVTVIKLFILPRFEARDRLRLANDNIRITPERLEVRYDGYKKGYVIDCFYTSPETGRKFVFSTPPFAADPTPYLFDAKILVIANRVDYSNYYIDMNGLENIVK